MVPTYINGLCFVINRLLEVVWAVSMDKLGVDAQSWEENLELVVRASVQVGRRNDVVASLCERGDGNELRSLARGGG